MASDSAKRLSAASEPAEPRAAAGAPRPHPHRAALAARLQARRARHRRRPKAVRMLYVAAGFAILFAGIVLLLAPGPAFVVIPIGLAVLSLEFTWAERLLFKAIEKSEQARQRAAQTSRRQRVLSGLVALVVLLAVVGWGVWGDIPVAPI